MSINGGDTASRLENFMRFVGLAGGQRRGEASRGASTPRSPSPDELRDLSLAQMLQQSNDGSEVLIQLLHDRIEEALAFAHANVTNHAVCVGFLGAHAALKRLYDDLHRLRG